MRRRLTSLLGVAACACAGAVAVQAARNERVPAPHIPAIPVARETVDDCCPIPARFRNAFERAAAELNLDVGDTSSNVLAGARNLQGLLHRFGSTDLALSAYNAGPTAVAAVGRAPTLQTVTYVANVNSIWRRLQGCAAVAP